MTRKISHIFISILLLISTAGVQMSMHYAGGKLFSISFYGEAEACCDSDCGCCHENTISFHVEDEFIASAAEYNILPHVIDLSVEATELNISKLDPSRAKLITLGGILKLPLNRPESRASYQVFLI